MFKKNNVTQDDDIQYNKSTGNPNMTEEEEKTFDKNAGNPFMQEEKTESIPNNSGGKIIPTEQEGVLSTPANTKPAQADAGQEKKGRNVLSWLKDTFRKPETEEKRRKVVDNIAAATDVLRHAANLYFTSKGATPQQIQSSYLQNEARRKEEDALKLEAAKRRRAQWEKDREWNLKLRQYADEQEKTMRDLAWKEEERQWQRDYKAAQEKQKQDNWQKTYDAQQKRHKDNLAMQERKLAFRRANAGRGGSGGGSSDAEDDTKKWKVYTTPTGVRYKLSPTFMNPTNVKTVYEDMVRHKVIKGQPTTYDTYGNAVPKTLSTNEMLSEILKAATGTKEGHDWFVKWGNNLGYRYVGGMDNKQKERLGIQQYKNESL